MKLRNAIFCLLLALPLVGMLSAADTLDIYYIDVEGGKALIVQNPSGQAMLIDGGMAGFTMPAGMRNRAPQRRGPAAEGRGPAPQAQRRRPAMDPDRDVNRVSAAAKAAGVTKFDVTLVTHYDIDHVGNIPNIAKRFPLGLLVDHGPLLPNPNFNPINRMAADAYVQFLPGHKRMIVKPGDIIPFEDVKITVVTSNEEVLTEPMEGAGQPNEFCPATLPERVQADDNGASIGTIWEFGEFRMADFADLLQWAEMKLMCPNNPIGTVDLFMLSHHGLAASNSAALVHALQPKATITDNGERKGIAPEVVQVLRSAPSKPDVWQLHLSTTAGEGNNAPEDFLANLSQENCEGHWIKVSARRDGSFTITNSRNNFSKTYQP